MARIFRALRRSSGPDSSEQMSPRHGDRRSSASRDMSPSFSRLFRQAPPTDSVALILQNIICELEEDSDSTDSYDVISDDVDFYTETVDWEQEEKSSRSIASHDLVKAIWGSGSNYIWQTFARIKTRMAGDHTFGAELKSDVTKSPNMTAMIDRLRNVTMADLVLPERSGWLFDLSKNCNMWCVVADMLFCIFDSEDSESPSEVLILPGCTIRSLVYHTAIPQPSSSKTISGIDKYQIIIDDCSSRRKYLFSVDCPVELEQWMTVLKLASTLDNDSDSLEDADTPCSEPRRHSVCSAVVTGRHGDFVSPRYIPTPSSPHRSTRYSSQLEDNIDNEACEKSPPGRSYDMKHAQLNSSIGDIRRKLRRDTEIETSKPSPMKARHFEPSQSSNKKPGPFKKIRSFGSLESLFKPKKKEENVDSVSYGERRSSKGSIASSKKSSSSSSLDCSISDSPLLRGHERRSLSAIDFSKSETDSPKALSRTPSDLKYRVPKSQSSVQLRDLHDASICGFLYQKVLIRWQKVWCMVCRGKLYGFKSQSPEEQAYLTIILSNSNITYVSDHDKKYKKLFVFKITRPHRKSVYLNASDKDELSRWLQVLQMEANKVQGDADSIDSGQGLSDSGTITFSPTSSSRTKWSPVMFSTDGAPSDSEISSTAGQVRRYSLPTFDGGNDSGYAPSSDETDYKEMGYTRNNMGLPKNPEAEHDPALRHVWQQDRNYLFNMVRAKLRRSKKRLESSSSNSRTEGPNDERLLVMTERSEMRSSERRPKGSGSRDVRRTMSFNGGKTASVTARESGLPPGVDSPNSSPSIRKRHKPLVVKKLAAREIENCTMCGYMERRSFSGQWIRYWYVLKDGTIFSYLTEDDNVTVDILNLQGYKIAYLIDKFRGKRFVLQLSHQEYSSVYMSLDSRDTMTEWLESLQLATGVPPSPHGIIDEQDAPEQLPDKSNDKEYQEKCQSVKQKLLTEMLRQKNELERKQASRQKRQNDDSNASLDVMSEENQIRDVTRLRQRRMSAQIKMDAIQKQMQNTSTSGKRFPFKFGAKKKMPENKNENLQEQLRELGIKLEEIDKDLSSHAKCNVDMLDMNQNKRQVSKTATDERTSIDFQFQNGDLNRSGPLNIKASVQKLKTKTFSKSKFKHRKSYGSELANGHSCNADIDSGNLLSSAHDVAIDLTKCRLQDDFADDHSGSESRRSDSFTDLTRNKSSTSSAEDNVFGDYEQNGPRRIGKSKHAEKRTEIDPNVLAEIDAFEDFTRQVLSARNAQPP